MTTLAREPISAFGCPCRVCGQLGPAQLDLLGNLAKIDYICKKCRDLPKEDKVLLYDGSGWRAFMDADDFEKYLAISAPTNGLYEIRREATIKIAKDAAKCDKNYINTCNELENLCCELEEAECEVSRLKGKISDAKKELDGYLTDYLYELFREVKS